MPNLDIPKLVASTLEDWINEGALQQVAFQGTPYLDMISKGGMIDSKEAAKEFLVNIGYAKNDNFTFYGGYDTWETAPTDGYGRARFGRKQAVMSWSLNGEEMEYNEGDKLWDVMTEIKEVTAKSLRDQINRRLINRTAAGLSGDTSLDVAWASLEDIIADDESAVTEYGGIDAADTWWWRSLIKRPGFTLPSNHLDENGWTRGIDANVIPTGDYAGWQLLKLDDITDMILVLDQLHTDGYVALTTRKIITNLMNLIKAEQLQVNTNLTGSLVGGHRGVEWMGVPFVYDQHIPEGTIYLIHPQDLRIRPKKSRWLTMREPITARNQDAIYGAVWAWGEQYSVNRRALGKFVQVAVA